MTEVLEQTEAKQKRNRVALTPEQKQASSLRRDAAMLLRLADGSTNPQQMREHAAQIMAKADTLAPAQKPKAEPRPQCSYVHPEGTKDAKGNDVGGQRCGAKSTKDSDTCFGHSNALAKLTEAEWNAVDAYFIGEDFHTRLLEGFSWRQLKEIATPVTAA
jgi:hypothetical protein